MFAGLEELNHFMIMNVFQGMPVWEKLKNYSNEDNNELARLEMLEFVYFFWMASHVSWLQVNERKSFSENGWGGGANLMTATPDNSTVIDLGKIANPNQFFVKSPLELIFPYKSSIARKAGKDVIEVTVSTATGEFYIMFSSGMGGTFQHYINSNLLDRLNQDITYQVGQFGVLNNKNIWLDYPQITIKYKPNRWSQFSKQAKREELWFQKIEKYMYKDFSWDLLREYYSVDFQAALNLFRAKYGELR
jgi:hypothetical protein